MGGTSVLGLGIAIPHCTTSPGDPIMGPATEGGIPSLWLRKKTARAKSPISVGWFPIEAAAMH